MNLPPLPLKNGCLEIDNSFLESFTVCPRRSEYSSLLKRSPATEQPALNFGSAIHRALEYRYKTFRNSAPDSSMGQEIFDKALKPYFDANPQPEDDHRTLQYAEELVSEYNNRFQHEPFSLLTDNKGEVMTEMSFAVPLFEVESPFVHDAQIPVIYTGRIDLPVLWGNQLIILDFKTASTLGQQKADEMKVSPQFFGYCWAFQELTKQKVEGFCVRAIRTKAKPGKPKAGWQSWWDESFMTVKEYVDQDQLNEWKFNVIALIEEFMWHYSRNFMPQKKKACMLYGKCPYYDVCYLAPGSRQEQLMSAQFTNNTWSPLK